MFKFAANLSMLFTEVPFMDRFDKAKEAGFHYVEFMFPYDNEAGAIKKKLETNGLKLVLFNLPSGDWAAGDRGLGAQPDRVEEFRAGVARAIEYSQVLGVQQINCQVGKCRDKYSDAEQWNILVKNVRYAAKELAAHNIRLIVEPINHFDIPGYYLTRTEQVLKLIKEAKHPNIFIQYDLYHAQRESGELVTTLRNHLDKIAHIQIADNPGRHQPGTGEINYPFVFSELLSLGYTGYIGLEYIPLPDSQSSFAWVKEYHYTL